MSEQYEDEVIARALRIHEKLMRDLPGEPRSMTGEAVMARWGTAATLTVGVLGVTSRNDIVDMLREANEQAARGLE